VAVLYFLFSPLVHLLRAGLINAGITAIVPEQNDAAPIAERSGPIRW